MRQLAFSIILFFASFTTFAQTTYNPEFLIPYNNNGKWGWCDTMGKMVLGGDFTDAHFFNKSETREGEYNAVVETESGSNVYNSKAGLLVPRQYDLIFDVYQGPNFQNRLAIIKDQSKKVGLYNTTEQVLAVKTEWDEFYYYDEWGTEMYFLGKGQKTYWGYNFKSKKLYKTLIDSIFEMNVSVLIDGREFFTFQSVFHHTNGKYTKFSHGVQVELTEEERKQLDDKYERSYSATDRGNQNPFSNDGSGKNHTNRQNQLTGIISELDYSTTKSATFQQLIIKTENGKVGAVSNLGDTILPFEYDNIYTKNRSTDLYMEKEGKVGMKLLFTAYPTIEPKYESLEKDRHKLTVNASSSFQLYRVKINGKSGLIGENGVEYFDFE